MAALFRSSVLGLGLAFAAAAACGGNTGTSDGISKAGTAGLPASAAGNTGSAGSGTSGGSGANGGGSAGTGGALSTGGALATGGSAGAAANTGGNAGAQTSNSTACNTANDCVIATVYASTGCCARTDCGRALNRDWVLREPCASADPSKDLVPASCSQGCSQCPASQCTEPVGVLCNAGECQTVSMGGPCSTDTDCVLAIDYTTAPGACCGCAEVVSKAFETAESCVELVAAPKPANCAIAGDSCAVFACPACTAPQPTCTMGRCLAR